MIYTRPCYLEVNLDKLKHNYFEIKKYLKEGTEIIAIVKSDAYHFGDVEITEKLISLGVEKFAVATMSEAISLRKNFKDIDILLLGPVPEYLIEEGIKNNIVFCIPSLQCAVELNNAAKKLNTVARAHFAVDTGMNRIGFKDNINEAEEAFKLSNIEVESAFTHLALSDVDEKFTHRQFDKFREFVSAMKERGCEFKYTDVSNSHAVLGYRDFDMEYVRPGILLYGSAEGDKNGKGYEVEFIGEIKAEVSFIKEVKKGEGISYGHIFVAEKDMKIATLPIGYADGIVRNLSGKISALVKGKRVRQVGRICMDQMMIDVTDMDVEVGDVAVIIGRQGSEEITIEEVADLAGEIPTSFVTHFSERLPRHYIEDGKLIKIKDDYLR